MLDTQFQQYIHLSRYARWREVDKRRETWSETVDRYVQFFAKRHPAYPTERLRDAILNLKVMPSMRALMTAGPALVRDELAGYNCAFIAVDNIRVFDEILYVLMCGTGVGFSVERQEIAKLPAVADHFRESGTTIVVSDSKTGWAASFKELLAMLWAGQVPKWDISHLRPAGAKLKVFGGRSSGPRPLVSLFEFAVNLVRGAAGRRLTSVECHDLVCKIADIVVVGGVRRSALISLSNLSDDRMRVAKTGQWWEKDPQRALANNSAVYSERPSMELFLAEWTALIQSKAGERGIFNRQAAVKKAAENGRRDTNFTLGTNPCFHRDTLIHTREGHFPISQLVDKEVEVWDGTEYVAIDNFRVTGTDMPVFQVFLHDGSEIVATAYHRFLLADGSKVELQDLEEGDQLLVSTAPVVEQGTATVGAYLKGFLLGDGTHNQVNPILWLYEPKTMCGARLIASGAEIAPELLKSPLAISELGFVAEATHGRRYMRGLTPRRTELMPWVSTCRAALPVECFAWSLRTKAEFIAGLFDADGNAMDTVNGFGYQLNSVSRDLLLGVQTLLKTMGVHSTLRMNRAAGVTDFGPDRGGEYPTRAVYRLTISQVGAIALAKLIRFERLPSFANRAATYNSKPRFNRVVSIEPAGVEAEVFCCTVPLTHRVALSVGVVTGQCGEILLRSAGLCNLTEVVVRADDTLDDLATKVEAATIMGTFQSTLTSFRYVRKVWERNAEEERLLGVSLTGMMDHPVLSTTSSTCVGWLEALRASAVRVNTEWAHTLGISPSVAITTVKPSGTVSQLVDAASGIHPRYAHRYIRTVRADKRDPLAVFMRERGFPVEDCVVKPEHTDVFAFPVQSPDHAVLRGAMTAVEQLEHYAMVRAHWCEHNPSITVYVRDHEWMAVGDWVYNHFDEVGGVSFLPYSDHSYQQAPYTECSEEEYEALKARMPAVVWSELDESEDLTTGTKELACTAGGCEIV